jgi:translation initiation factor IF-3
MFSITGTIKVKGNEQQVSEKFKKREFVITENSSQYPQHISFQLTQERCSLVENFKMGDEIKVFFNLRGREWTSPQNEVKYFNSLEAWKVETVAKTSSPDSSSMNEAPPVQELAPALTDDDLPF